MSKPPTYRIAQARLSDGGASLLVALLRDGVPISFASTEEPARHVVEKFQRLVFFDLVAQEMRREG